MSGSFLNFGEMNVFSLDIETTGLDHKTSKIWSVGSSNKFLGADGKFQVENNEHFIRDVIPENLKRNEKNFLQRAHGKGVGTAEMFGKVQKDSGAFDNYQAAYRQPLGTSSISPATGQAINPLQNLDDVFRGMTKDLKNTTGLFLIQNTPFESGAFSAAGDKSGGQGLSPQVRDDFLKGVFGVDPEQYKNSKSLIPQDSRILEARDKFTVASERFKHSSKFSQETITNFKGQLKEASDSLESTINMVVKENDARGFRTAVDLMDVSRLYTAKLATEDLLQPSYVNTGLSVDYLAGNLLKEKESHTAMRDSDQQRRILEKTSRAMSNINIDGLSPGDAEFATELMDSEVHEKTFVKNIENRLTEALKKKESLKDSEVSSLISKSLRNYQAMPEKANFNRLAFAEDIRQSFIKDPSKAFQKLNDIRSSEFLPKIAPLASPDSSPLLKGGSLNSKVLLGMSALGATMLLSSNNGQSKKREMNSYDDLYENVYLGQSYADWQDRNNSHKMIY